MNYINSKSHFKFSRILLVAFTIFQSFVINFSVFAEPTDSLLLELSNANTIKERFNIHLQLSEAYWNTDQDSVLFHLNKAEGYAKAENLIEEVVKVANNKAVFFNDLGEYDKALQTLNEAFELTDESTNPNLMGRLLGNIGNTYAYKNYLSKAIDFYSKAIIYLEADKDESGMANLYGTLGNLMYKNQNYDDAIVSYNNARSLFVKLGVKGGEAVTEMNIGNCLKKLNQADSAFVYYERALGKYNALGNMPYYKAMCLANIGNLHANNGELKEAERYLLEAEPIFMQIKNSYSIAQVNLDLADLYIKTEKFNLAMKRIETGLEIIKEYDYFYLQLLANRLLWDYYKSQNDYKNAHYWLIEYMEVNDSLEKLDRRENVDLLLAQFETERKEREIEILKKNDEINQLKIRRRTQNLYILILGLVIAFASIVFLYVSRRKVTGMNKLLAFQNVEIGQQKEEITSQRDEIESQRDMLQDQNEILEEFKTHTNESLRYAQSIQAAILPSSKVLQQISSEYFVLIKPCELVSGDFFWATTFDDYQVLCVADCTGHGVPGAFMSILGITALNDIVSRHKVSRPNEILGYLRESVIEALSQNDPEQLHKDGMDIALCVFNVKTRELQFAGAGLPLWVVSNEMPESISQGCLSKQLSLNSFSLCEIKGDIMPVGESPRKGEFTNHQFSLHNSNICIYLSSDGYIDQLGGAEGRKFHKQNLLEKIISIQGESMENQKFILDKTFEDWKNSYKQIDDVTVLGIKI
ncbi:MAG: hypothetical protein CVT98_01705 [Bacteroidetes bacterium HGW-Bacteroidetes-15]|nr:MAG: hypothetical protein CVT98_01705 [Bacteroidetes bacterium HGW-Bacteroidetes-15]